MYKDQAHDTISRVEEALYRLTDLPNDMNAELDKMLIGSQSLDSAKRLAALPIWQTSQSHLIDKVQEQWLPYLKEAGFFEDPPPAKGYQSGNYERWAPAVYLEKCANGRQDVTDIILSCKFSEQPNPAVCTDFLRCAAVLPTASAEKVGRKALQEGWDRFMWHEAFRAIYVEIATKLALDREYDIATRMLCRALKPEPSELFPTAGTVGVVVGNYEPADPFMFERLLSKMPTQFGRDEQAKNQSLPVIKLLDSLLYESLRPDKQGRKTDGDDGECGCSDTDEISPRGMAGMTSSLFRCMKDCIAKDIDHKDRTKVMKVLYNRDHCMYRRLEMHAYAEFHCKFKCEAKMSVRWPVGSMHTCPEYRRLLGMEPPLPDNAKLRMPKRVDGRQYPDT